MNKRESEPDKHCAWLIGAFSDHRYVTSLSPDEYPERALVSKRVRLGEAELTDHFPSAFYGSFDLIRKALPELDVLPPPLFIVRGGLPIVTEACAEVLRDYELGRTELRPVELFRKDRTTPVIEGRFFGLFPGEHRASLVVNATTAKLEQARVDPPLYQTYDTIVDGTLTDDMLALSPAAFEPPDLWIDDTIMGEMMISGRLGRALIDAGWKDSMLLTRCRIVDGGAGL